MNLMARIAAGDWIFAIRNWIPHIVFLSTIELQHTGALDVKSAYIKYPGGGSISVRAGVAIKTHDRQDQQILGNVSFR
jgi:hypothetical protein